MDPTIDANAEGTMAHGKKKRNKRRSETADEVFTTGPITVARRGRITQVSSNWSPEAYQAMRAQLPARRLELGQSVDESVTVLVDLLKQYDPLHILLTLFANNCLVNPETYSEPEHHGKEAYVEYAQSLAAAVRDHGTKSPDERVIASFEDHVRKAMEGCAFHFGFRETPDGSTLDAQETKFLGMVRHLFIRGSSIQEHDTRLVEAIFGPHENFFRRNGVFTAAQLIAFADRVSAAAQVSTDKITDALVRLKALQAEYARMLDKDPEADPAAELLRLKKSDAAEEARRLFKEGSQESRGQVPYNDENRIFCDRLSLRPGDNESFLTFKKSPGWPSNDSRIYRQPLLHLGNDYYCPNPILLSRNRVTILDQLIKDTDPTFYSEQFAKKRGEVAEELAIQHLARLLPGAEVFPNVYYRMEQAGEIRRFETDALIVFDEFLFVIETKSAPFSTPALRGADHALAKDLGHLVGEPYSQALRTLSYIKSAPVTPFEEEDGTIAISIEHQNFHQTFLVNVTLADIGHVAGHLNSAKTMGLLPGREWPWSVFVNDLRVISEIVETPAQFLLFLERRLALNDHPAITTVDELDYLGMFLKDGLYFDAADLSGIGRLSTVGYTVPIERYYDHLAGRVTTGEKPRLNITDWYRGFTKNIETSGLPGGIRTAINLLAIEGVRQREIEGWYRQYGRDTETTSTSHTLTLLGQDGPSFVLWLARNHDSSLVAGARDYARMKRLQTRCASIILVVLEATSCKPLVIDISEGDVVQTPALETTLATFRTAKMREYMAQFGMPARNDPCPCNSGRKFKKCCYLDM